MYFMYFNFFALGYRKIQKTGTAVQSLTRLPVWIEAVGRAVSNETETINRNMDAIMLKLTALQVKIDDFRDQKWTERIKLWKVCSCSPQKTQLNLILSFLAPPYRLAWPRSCWINYPGRALQCRLSCSLPPLQTLLPSPINCLRTLWTATCRAGLRPAP